MSTKDPFGFTKAVKTPSQSTKGCFAVFIVDGKGKATGVYTEKFLNDMVIPDMLGKLGDVKYYVFPESEFERITGHKPY